MRIADHCEEGDPLKVGRFLKTLMVFFVCIAFIRAAFGAGELSASNMLLDLQSFRFDFDDVLDLVDFFREGRWSDGIANWNYSLIGIEGFFRNISNVLISFFSMVGSLFSVFFKALWNLLFNVFRLLGNLLRIALEWTGIS